MSERISRAAFWLIVLAIAVLFLTRCASVPVAEQIVRQESVNETARSLVDKSNLTPDEKSFVGRALTDSLGMAKTENKRATIADKKADDLAIYRNIVVAVGLALSGFLIWRFW